MSNPSIPDHIAQAYPTACGNCHTTISWADAHPDNLFPISTGAHMGITCNQCHSSATDTVGSVKGANTLCASSGCHAANEPLPGGGTTSTGHSDIATFDGYTAPPAGYTTQNFCLACHPSGQEIPHDDTIFPQSHHASTCASCHDRTKGSDQLGQNADCRRCHQDLSTDDHPSNIATLASPSGCLQMGCHYGGRGGN